MDCITWGEHARLARIYRVLCPPQIRVKWPPLTMISAHHFAFPLSHVLRHGCSRQYTVQRDGPKVNHFQNRLDIVRRGGSNLKGRRRQKGMYHLNGGTAHPIGFFRVGYLDKTHVLIQFQGRYIGRTTTQANASPCLSVLSVNGTCKQCKAKPRSVTTYLIRTPQAHATDSHWKHSTTPRDTARIPLTYNPARTTT